MIDKNGKLFGKLNIIDLLIVLVLIAAVLSLVLRPKQVEDTDDEEKDTQLEIVNVTFYADYVPSYVPESMQIGDPLVDFLDSHKLGKLISFETEDGYALTYDQEKGETVSMDLLNRVFMTFTAEAEGEFTRNGFKVGYTTYVVGGSYMINVGPTRVSCYVKSFEPTGVMVDKPDEDAKD